MRRVHGFTLIEVLVAVALLTLVATAAVSWAVSQRRSGALIDVRYERLRQLVACQQALREDLRVAVLGNALQPDEGGRLVLTTLRYLPDEEPGRREATWRFDEPRQALVRSTPAAGGERVRVAVSGLASARFTHQERRGLVLVVQPLSGDPVSVMVKEGR